MNGIFYVVRGGIAWRLLPKDLPPKSTVYGYFSTWRDSGLFAAINHHLVILDDLTMARPNVSRHSCDAATLVRDWATSAGPYLARAVNVIESTLDPETIVIGGPAPQGLVDWLIEAVEPLPVSVGSRANRANPRRMQGGTGTHLAALGAASLPVFEEDNPTFELLFKR